MRRSSTRGPVLELAQGDLRFTPTGSVRARAQFRYLGVAAENQPLLRGEVQTRAGGYFGASISSWDAFQRFGIGLLASGHHDSQSDMDQADAGLELRSPRLFGDVGGLAAGASAGEGWLRTRTAFVQIMARTSRLRIFGRVGGWHHAVRRAAADAADRRAGREPPDRRCDHPVATNRRPIACPGPDRPPGRDPAENALYGVVSRIDLVGTY